MAALESQGWLIGKASEYDKVNAVYPEDLIGYFQSAYPDRWDKFCKNNPQNPEQVLIKATTRELDKRGWPGPANPRPPTSWPSSMTPRATSCSAPSLW